MAQTDTTPDPIGALDVRELQRDAQIGLALMREWAPGPTLSAADIDMLGKLSALVMTNTAQLHYPPDAPPTLGEVVARTLGAAFAMGRGRREV